MARNRGFSLFELMIATAVAAILLTLGLPSFSSSVRQNCVVSGANSFLATLMQARSEALSRGRTVSICKSNDGIDCARGSAGSWTQGFVMYDDLDGNGIRGASETVIASSVKPMSCGSLSTNRYTNYISYDSEGKANSNGSFFVVANNAAGVNRTIAVFVGRVRVCSAPLDKSCSAPP